ncbi:HCP-like protein [Zymoseptoria brevis]|uniref:HCP-like protein n=1 Tax=Zymoseptoria brevis TaxID=1047168 RepID=A0A0F4GXQ5_9PEZI|nr:HCP-like protein [Zymoseptoria brevis]
MPSLRDLLKKKDKIVEQSTPENNLSPPEFIRTTTFDFERIEPPSYPEDNQSLPVGKKSKHSGEHKRTLGFRSLSQSSTKAKANNTSSQATTDTNGQQLPTRPKSERRLSGVLHLHSRSHSRSNSAELSVNLPRDLPEAPEGTAVERPRSRDDQDEGDKEAKEHREAQWEKRATILAKNSPLRDGALQTAQSEDRAQNRRSKSPSISDATGDVNIQEAIRLHEAGDLPRSTEMFGQLARPEGANNALAQVLYGLALRHGWGITIEPQQAIHYLSLAAANSASIEEEALASSKQGGAAKGELVLAIYELANCFRHGWGVKKDASAARTYYETAANLGDTDAMEEAAWCLLEGFGGPKDKFKAAQYLRLAEEKGSKHVGESWIWKEKYNPPKK